MEIYNSKIFGWLKFSKSMSIHQIRQIFLAQKFPSVRYTVHKICLC